MKQVCKYLDITSTTLRTNWVPEYAEYLSEHATPPKGQERRFTEEDVSVLATVAVLRQQGVDFPDIHKALAAGERLELPAGERGQSTPTPAPEGEGDQTAVAVAAFQSALASYDARVNKLESKLEEAQAARLAAEIRAARLEGELTTLQAIMQAQAAPPVSPDPDPDPPAPPAAAPPSTLAAAIRAWWQSRRAAP